MANLYILQNSTRFREGLNETLPYLLSQYTLLYTPGFGGSIPGTILNTIQNCNLSIGAIGRSIFVVNFDDGTDLYIKPGMFVGSGTTYTGDVRSEKPYFYVPYSTAYDGMSFIDITTDNPSDEYGKLRVKFIYAAEEGIPERNRASYIIMHEFVIREDMRGYATAFGITDNATTLLKTSANDPLILGEENQVTTPSVFKFNSNSFVSYVIGNTPVNKPYAQVINNVPVKLKWYNRGVLNANIGDSNENTAVVLETDIKLLNKNTQQLVSNISPSYTTEVHVSFKCNYSVHIIAYAYLIRVDSVSNNSPFIEDLNMRAVGLSPNNALEDYVTAYPNGFPSPEITNWFYDRTFPLMENDGDAVKPYVFSFNPPYVLDRASLADPSQPPLIECCNPTPAEYKAYFTLFNTVPPVSLDGRYRVITVFYFRKCGDPGSGTIYGFNSFSRVTQEFGYKSIPDLVHPVKNTAFFSDYNNIYGQELTVTPQERIKITSIWEGDKYNDTFTSGGRAILAAANMDVNIILYKKEATTINQVNATYRHVVKEFLVSRNNSQWTSSDSDVLVYTDINGRTVFEGVFRVRYEPDIPNIRTELVDINGDVTVLPTPLSTQDWAGKIIDNVPTNQEIFVDVILSVQQKTITGEIYIDRFERELLLKVKPFDEEILSISFTNDTDIDLLSLCDTTNQLKVKIEAQPDDQGNRPFDSFQDDYLIGGMDYATPKYTINNFKEHESYEPYPGFPGNNLTKIDQLTQLPIRTIYPKFLIDAGTGLPTAYASVNAFELPLNKKTRFSAIKKKFVDTSYTELQQPMYGCLYRDTTKGFIESLNDYPYAMKFGNSETLVPPTHSFHYVNMYSNAGDLQYGIFIYETGNAWRGYRLIKNGSIEFLSKNQVYNENLLWNGQYAREYFWNDSKCFPKAEIYNKPSNKLFSTGITEKAEYVTGYGCVLVPHLNGRDSNIMEVATFKPANPYAPLPIPCPEDVPCFDNPFWTVIKPQSPMTLEKGGNPLILSATTNGLERHTRLQRTDLVGDDITTPAMHVAAYILDIGSVPRGTSIPPNPTFEVKVDAGRVYRITAFKQYDYVYNSAAIQSNFDIFSAPLVQGLRYFEPVPTPIAIGTYNTSLNEPIFTTDAYRYVILLIQADHAGPGVDPFSISIKYI